MQRKPLVLAAISLCSLCSIVPRTIGARTVSQHTFTVHKYVCSSCGCHVIAIIAAATAVVLWLLNKILHDFQCASCFLNVFRVLCISQSCLMCIPLGNIVHQFPIYTFLLPLRTYSFICSHYRHRSAYVFAVWH